MRTPHCHYVKGVRLAASRNVLGTEFVLGMLLAANGYAGSFGIGSLNRILGEAGLAPTWGWLMLSSGICTALGSAANYLTIDWSDRWQMRLALFRTVANAGGTVCWMATAQFLWESSQVNQVFAVSFCTLLAIPFCAVSFVKNYRVWYSLDPEKNTPGLLFDRRRT
jgi:hypothetical protein